MRATQIDTTFVVGLFSVLLGFSAASHAGNAHYWFFTGPTLEELQFLEEGSARDSEDEGFTLDRVLEGTAEYPSYWAYANDAGRVRTFLSPVAILSPRWQE